MRSLIRAASAVVLLVNKRALWVAADSVTSVISAFAYLRPLTLMLEFKPRRVGAQ